MASLDEILSCALKHPMYTPLLELSSSTSEATAPSNTTAVSPTINSSDDTLTHPTNPPPSLSLSQFPVVSKKHLNDATLLLSETDPSFLYGVYISPSGGYGGTTSFFFPTAISENARQRVLFAKSLSTLRIFTPTDIVLNIHDGGPLYRSQELMSNLIALCGATDVLANGSHPEDKVVRLGVRFRANAMTGTSSSILRIARYVASLPAEQKIIIKKLVYTSEILSPTLEEYVRRELGTEEIASVYGSAEAGTNFAAAPWRQQKEAGTDHTDFMFDKRMIVVEILGENGEIVADSAGGVSSDQKGEILLTSLCRRRNPVVRHQTGDIGSLPPGGEKTVDGISLQTLRLYGRGTGSFSVNGEYLDTLLLEEELFGRKEFGVLAWQAVVDHSRDNEMNENQCIDRVEFRVVLQDESVKEAMETVIAQRFLIPKVGTTLKCVGIDDMITGRLARKIRKIVDLRWSSGQ